MAVEEEFPNWYLEFSHPTCRIFAKFSRAYTSMPVWFFTPPPAPETSRNIRSITPGQVDGTGTFPLPGFPLAPCEPPKQVTPG